METLRAGATVACLMLYIAVVSFLCFRYAHRSRRTLEAAKQAVDSAGASGKASSAASGKSSSAARLVEECRRSASSLATFEFPFTYRLALELGLLRTYGIPSINLLLSKTGVFPQKPGKRSDDTDLLLLEIFDSPVDSPRSEAALARINAIHTQYGDKISNEDMLYVLSVIILEPGRWIARAEWRTLSAAEEVASFELWAYYGRRMGILRIPPTLADLEAWNQDFERRHMHYAASNVSIARCTIDNFLSVFPGFLRPFGETAAYCLMDGRLRAAMGFPDPNPWLRRGIFGVVWLRNFALRYFFLPRPGWMSARRTPFHCSADGTHCPRFNLYANTYGPNNGYKICNLGDAPAGALFPATSCPVYRGASAISLKSQ